MPENQRPQDTAERLGSPSAAIILQRADCIWWAAVVEFSRLIDPSGGSDGAFAREGLSADTNRRSGKRNLSTRPGIRDQGTGRVARCEVGWYDGTPYAGVFVRLVAAPGFKPGVGSGNQVLGGFDSHTLPPFSSATQSDRCLASTLTTSSQGDSRGARAQGCGRRGTSGRSAG